MTSPAKVKAPFSYFGAKSRVAPIIWQGFGQIANYIEPFCGSLAVLLANPSPSKIETVNDLDCLLVNFWRAVSQNPEEVTKFADYPVHEVELHARHRWLLSAMTEDFRRQMNEDPNFYDAKMAGYWVWGMGASIGNNWLQPKGLKALPILSSAGGGIHGLRYPVDQWMTNLQKRTRRVRVCCGDWKKVITPAITYENKGLALNEMTGVFLDPPYPTKDCYKVYREDTNIFQEVCQWAIDNGDSDKMRIVVCGYQGEVVFPQTWQEYCWQTNGGLGNMGQGQGRANKVRETIWLSPHCLEIG